MIIGKDFVGYIDSNDRIQGKWTENFLTPHMCQFGTRFRYNYIDNIVVWTDDYNDSEMYQVEDYLIRNRVDVCGIRHKSLGLI